MHAATEDGRDASIAATATALPQHHYSQRELAETAQRLLPALAVDPRVLERLFDRVGVHERYLALPADEYASLSGLHDRCEAWLSVALELGERTVRDALRYADLDPAEVSMLMTTTVTGIAVPSIDARLMNRIDFAPTLKRIPLFGLGCVAGVAGIARASEYLRAFPDQIAILLSVELCSLTVQRDDASVANIISSGLFGDGAAAALLVGAEHPLAAQARPRVIDSRSTFFPHTERAMGWDIVDSGFKIVLDSHVPDIVRRGLPDAVDGILADHDLSRDRIETWIMHPGGPAVIDAVCETLALTPDRVSRSRRSLARVGNLSSASVLFLLDEFRRELQPSPGSYGVMIAMGPAFCAEVVLLQW